MKTVLFIESGVFGGGSFTSLKKHIYALDLNKVRPIIVFFNKNGLIDEFKTKNIKVHIVKDSVFTRGGSKIFSIANALFMKGYLNFLIMPYLRLLHKKSIHEISNICRTEGVNFIHLNTELFRDRVGLLVGDLLELPVISHLRSKYELGSITFNKSYISFANRRVSKYVAVSKDTADFWIREVGINANKCEVIYDYYEIIDTQEVEKGFRGTDLRLLCVANIVPVKAHDFLLRSLAPILKEYNARLFLVGHGEKGYINELKRLIDRLSINSYVEFLGHRRDVPQLLTLSDIVLLLSKREGLPNILIEALGLGCVVIATNVGGIPEIIKHNENGFIVSYGDESAVQNSIKSILSNSIDIASIRLNAIKTIEEKFKIETYRALAEKLYE